MNMADLKGVTRQHDDVESSRNMLRHITNAVTGIAADVLAALDGAVSRRAEEIGTGFPTQPFN